MKANTLPARAALAALFLLLWPGQVRAQRNLSEIPNPDPELERRSFQVAEGFEVNLFAADPLLAKPIQMNFDAEGRLWVASSEVYPQILPGQEANDRVLVLTDADADGRAERIDVFAGGLLIPTGVEPGDGGAYVANSTELVHLADTNGDGRADRRRVVLSGFGTEDTHHILHTLRWGYDGMLYFNQSTYIHSHVETPYGVKRLGGGGIWQFRPESMQLEVFIRGLINPWGHHFDRWGQSFATDGAGGEGINYLVPGAAYAWAVGVPRVLVGLNPGSPKYCGEEVLSGRHLPEEWRGNILTNDFRGNRVCRFVLTDDGSGFAAREEPELIKTSHVAFRPIDIKMGPDGAIYIADWYNPIIQHGEVDFRDPRRDHTRGRIWRVTAKGRPLLERPKLAGKPVEVLLEALKAPEDWTRHFAKRVLKERGAAAVAPALATWAERLDRSDPDYEHRRLEALWTFQALDVVEPELAQSLLRAQDPRVRAAAVRVVGQWHARLSDPLALLSPLVTDDHPRVRLEAVRALGQIPGVRSAALALRALDLPTDRFLDFALWLTARELAPSWLPDAQAGRLDFGTHARLLFALEAVGGAEAIGPLQAMLKSGKLAPAETERVLGMVAALGTPHDLALVLERVMSDETAAASERARLLDALAQGTRTRRVRPEGDLSRLGPLLKGGDESLRASAVRAAGVWKVESLRPALDELARSPNASALLRRAAMEALAALAGRPSLDVLEQLASSNQEPQTRLMALAALAGLDLKRAAAQAAEVLASDLKGADPALLFTSFLERRGGPAAIGAALAGRTLPADTAKIGIRLARATPSGEAAFVATLSRAGGLSAGSHSISTSDREQLLADVSRLGDPARGEAVFRRNDLACLKCHSIAGAGGRVAPDLVSIGASAPVDYLLDSILDPQKAVKENYHALAVATDDGRILTGIKARQTESELVLRDADDREMAIPLRAIEEQKPAGSIMPVGLADSITRGELLDLVRFLSELGKVDSHFSVGRARVARRWEAAESTGQPGDALGMSAKDVVTGSDPRLRSRPVYSQVSGTLPMADVSPIALRSSGLSLGFVRCQIEVTTAGPVKLLLNSSVRLELWIDKTRFDCQNVMTPDLASGVHTITFAIDLAQRHEGLRLEIEDAPGSAARAQMVGGK